MPAPDIPEKIATELSSELPELLRRRVDGSVTWEVPVVVDPLTGTDREAPELLDVCRERMLSEGWDLAVCLTDLPVYRDGRLVVADVSAKRGAFASGLGRDTAALEGTGAYPPAYPRAVREDKGDRPGPFPRARSAGLARVRGLLPQG